MANNVTTARSGMFRVEDATFRGARMQSEIEKELAQERGVTLSEGVLAPVSLTPEAVKTFYKKKSEETSVAAEKRLYEQTIKWIDELSDTKKRLNSAELKLSQYAASREGEMPEDLQD